MMSTTVVGNNNIVAGRDNNIMSNTDNSVIEKIPKELQEEFKIITQYLCRTNISKEKKASCIKNFTDSLIATGASAISGEVVKYLFALLQ